MKFGNENIQLHYIRSRVIEKKDYNKDYNIDIITILILE